MNVQEPPGVEVKVSPSRFRSRRGSATFTVRIKRISAAFDEFAFGSVTWSDGKHHVRSPLAVRPVALAAPVSVSGAGVSGSTDIPVTAGYTGTLRSSVVGLVPSDVSTLNLRNPSGQAFPRTSPAASDHTAKFTVNVPAGTKLARFSTFDSDYPGGTDLEFSSTGPAPPRCSEPAPAAPRPSRSTCQPGRCVVRRVRRPLLDRRRRVLLDAKLNSWSLGTTTAGNATVTPESKPVTIAEPTHVTVNWSGLDAGRRWLGQVTFSDGGTASSSTLVRVDS